MTIDVAARRLALRAGIPLMDLHAKPCAGFANCCTCPACKQQDRAINAHRSAGRNPFDAEGKVKPAPPKRQPWHTRAA